MIWGRVVDQAAQSLPCTPQACCTPAGPGFSCPPPCCTPATILFVIARHEQGKPVFRHVEWLPFGLVSGSISIQAFDERTADARAASFH